MPAPSQEERSPAVVTAAARVRATPEEVWRALLDVETARGWLGRYAAAPTGEEMTTLTFPDGDIFLLQVLEAAEPSRLQYVCAALGIGVESTVSWRLAAVEEGCLVEVSDREPERTPEQAARDGRRWTEILGRLDRFLEGGPIGAVCRNEFDAGIELAATVEGASALLLEPTAHARWLPLESERLVDGAVLGIDDGAEPSAVRADDVVADQAAGRLAFSLSLGDRLRPTSCTLDVASRRSGAMVTVRHDGWADAGLDLAELGRQRARWCKAWARALRKFTLLYVRGLELPVMSTDELRSRLDEDGLFLFDTNVQARWDEGHLPGATHVGPQPLAPELLPRNRSSTLVFYCRSPF